MYIVLLVCFVVIMLMWLLSMLNVGEAYARYSPWLAFFACLILGIVVFVHPVPVTL